MPKRTIKTALGTYVNTAGVPEFGFKGDEVDVHSDHVARFDEHNIDNGEAAEHPRQDVSLIGTTSGLNTTVTEDEVSESDAGDDEKPRRGSRSK